MRTARFVALALISIALTVGCTTTQQMNDLLTPSLRAFNDDFDGALTVRQPPVSAASSFSDAFHGLGFEWGEKTPLLVFLTAEAPGIAPITGLAFNVDGKIIQNVDTASATSEFRQYGGRSARRFVLPFADFAAIAGGRDVKMRVTRVNDYSVSAFGSEHANAIVNSKFPPFLEKVQELRAQRK